MSPTRSLAAALLLSALFASPPSARAYEERNTYELGLGPSLGVGPGAAPGLSAEGLFTWGLGTHWSIGASARYSWYHGDARAHRLVPALELTWQLDIVRWVPRIGFGVGPAILLDDSIRVALASHLRLGIDRLTEFGFYGFDLRFDGYGPGGEAGMARLGVSLALRIGFMVDRF